MRTSHPPTKQTTRRTQLDTAARIARLGKPSTDDPLAGVAAALRALADVLDKERER